MYIQNVKYIKPTFNLPDFNKKIPLYDSAATIGDATNGKAPNITGVLTHWNAQSDGHSLLQTNGCFYNYNINTLYKVSVNGTTRTDAETGLDASRSSAVYDNNATGIVPAGVYMLWCIKY